VGAHEALKAGREDSEATFPSWLRLEDQIEWYDRAADRQGRWFKWLTTPAPLAEWVMATNYFPSVRSVAESPELQEYYAGTRREFDVPFVLTGSEWQKAVWRALTRIPFGETRSYAEVAAMVGRKGAARAVGRANATNRLPVVVPCHRVIGTDGSLTGFAGGTHLKTRLLEHEARVLANGSVGPVESV